MKFITSVLVFVLAASLSLSTPVPENSLRSADTSPIDDGMYCDHYMLSIAELIMNLEIRRETDLFGVKAALES